MSIKNYKPYTPSRRAMTTLSYEEITKKTPEKSLLVTLKKSGGRNQQGVITTRHIGGGNKRKYRIIDFKRNKDGVVGKVAGIEYDPNRNANIALIHYLDGEKRYIIHPKGLKVGDKIVSGENVDIVVGNALPLKNIPEGTFIHNIELKPLKGGQLCRSAGCAAQILGKEIRPTVRGSAMNPPDHPHGGGEGKCPVGRDAPRTPWGKRALGVKTRKTKKASSKLIIKRRNDK